MTGRRGVISFRLAVLLVVAPMLSACAGSLHYGHPELASHVAAIKTVAAVLVDAEVYFAQLNSRPPEPRDDWTRAARANLMNAAITHFNDGRFAVKAFDANDVPSLKEEWPAVRSFIQSRTLGDFDPKGSSVRCLAGPVPALAAAADADAVLLIYGRDTVLSTGFKAFLLASPVWLALSAPAIPGAIVAAALSSSPPPPSLAKLDGLTLCLADPRTGETLWFAFLRLFRSDLRDPDSVDRLMKELHDDFVDREHGPIR